MDLQLFALGLVLLVSLLKLLNQTERISQACRRGTLVRQLLQIRRGVVLRINFKNAPKIVQRVTNWNGNCILTPKASAGSEEVDTQVRHITLLILAQVLDG